MNGYPIFVQIIDYQVKSQCKQNRDSVKFYLNRFKICILLYFPYGLMLILMIVINQKIISISLDCSIFFN